MAQDIRVVARTFEVQDNQGMNEDLTLLAGKAAGICYMPDDYMEKGIQNTEKAMKRAAGTAKSGHHSVFDHGHITFVVKTNKVLAMLLNSVGAYTTSEKSARYTVMHPETELELTLYDKWRIRLQGLILEKYPDMSEKEADKLSIENARYLISIFTPTTMEYTISFRQAFLTADYLERLSRDCRELTDSFSSRLGSSAGELAGLLREQLGEMRVADNKNQYFRFLEYQHSKREATPKKEIVGDSYTLVYTGSLAILAQIQRHRTLRYSMFFDGNPERFGFYIPTIVKEAGFSEEWLRDISSVAYCIPQGTLVRITEQGIFEDFALKCKERLCGRAQLEVTKNTEASVWKFIKGAESLCEVNQELLTAITYTPADGGTMQPCARCMFRDFVCTEGCRFGAKEALARII